MFLLTKKTRTILFWTFVFLFFGLFLILIFSSFGFKVSFKDGSLEIQKTGAFYLEAKPDDNLTFYLNKKLENPKKRLFGGYFFETLLPGKYLVEVKKDNYFGWKKNIEILPGLVSFAKINLIKKNQKQEFLLKTSSTLFSVSEKKQKLIFKNKNQIEIFDLKEKKVKKINLPKKIIIKKIYTHPFSSKKLLIINTNFNSSTSSIFEFDISKEKLKKIKTLNSNFYKINPENGDLFYIDKKGNLFKENIFHNTKDLILSASNLSSNSTSTLKLEEFKLIENKFLILKTNIGKFIFDLDSKKFLIKEPIKANLILPDKSREKIVFYQKNEIKTRYLKKIFSPLIRNKGKIDVLINLPSVKKIEFYKDNWYLFVLVNKKLFFLELDPREPINSYSLSNNVENFWYFKEKNFLLLLKNNNFFILKLLNS